MKLRQKLESELGRQLTVGVQRATNRGWLAGRSEEEKGPGRGKAWKLPLTSMEQQLPCCSLKALEVCMQHIKLLSDEREHEIGTACSLHLRLCIMENAT